MLKVGDILICKKEYDYSNEYYVGKLYKISSIKQIDTSINLYIICDEWGDELGFVDKVIYINENVYDINRYSPYIYDYFYNKNEMREKKLNRIFL